MFAATMRHHCRRHLFAASIAAAAIWAAQGSDFVGDALGAKEKPQRFDPLGLGC